MTIAFSVRMMRTGLIATLFALTSSISAFADGAWARLLHPEILSE